MTQRTHSRIAEQSSTTPDTTHESTDGPTDGSGPVAGAGTDRRGVLKAAGVFVGAGALAACSSPPVPTESGGASSSAGSSSSAATSEATSGATSAASGGTPTSDVPVGGAKFYADTKTVVTQPVAGTFKAFDTTCPHQGCAVNSVEGTEIVCPCHKSHFDMTSGAPTADSAAKKPLTAKQVSVSGDTFTVA